MTARNEHSVKNHFIVSVEGGITSGTNPMNGLQACIYKLVNTSFFSITCNRQWSQIQSATTCSSTLHLQVRKSVSGMNFRTLVTTSSLRKAIYSQACNYKLVNHWGLVRVSHSCYSLEGRLLPFTTCPVLKCTLGVRYVGASQATKQLNASTYAWKVEVKNP